MSLPRALHTMRAKLIGHFQSCMTDIYLHIDARMADYIRTDPYVRLTDVRRTLLVIVVAAGPKRGPIPAYWDSE